ncbi:MmpS family transport accessory protein [Actinopolyspora mortivallis]|uniref:MmpS family transport accessory protein n=1 Tax=Actinopolyspora mortivallis TaxID=33906 RepID=UPI00037F0898|nr:MmpS family transport accessory protein [Actinopolyspora mortivallis]
MTDTHQQSGGSAAAPKNGMGITALVLGIVGILLAWIPVIGFLGFILGILAIIFGVIAVVRAHKGTATNMVMSYIGLAAGVVALVVSIVVFTVLVNEVDKQLDNMNTGPGGGQGAPSRDEQGGSGTEQGDGAGQVVYEITGSGSVASVTYGKGTQTSQDTNAELPWSQKTEAAEGVEFYSLTAQNGQEGGEIACKITVDGEVLAENTSNGPHAVVNCNGNTGF